MTLSIAAPAGVVSFRQLACTLQMKPGQRLAAVNVPPDGGLVVPRAAALYPDDADAVIGFVTEPTQLPLLDCVYAAARDARPAWLGHPRGWHRGWLTSALGRYGVRGVDERVIGGAWIAVHLRGGPRAVRW